MSISGANDKQVKKTIVETAQVSCRYVGQPVHPITNRGKGNRQPRRKNTNRDCTSSFMKMMDQHKLKHTSELIICHVLSLALIEHSYMRPSPDYY